MSTNRMRRIGVLVFLFDRLLLGSLGEVSMLRLGELC
jgi:hypothetical protein